MALLYGKNEMAANRYGDWYSAEKIIGKRLDEVGTRIKIQDSSKCDKGSTSRCQVLFDARISAHSRKHITYISLDENIDQL